MKPCAQNGCFFSKFRLFPFKIKENTVRAFACFLLLSGCATQEHYIATSCVKDVPARPQIHSNADLIAASPADRYKGIAADRFRLIDENNQLWALIDACR